MSRFRTILVANRGEIACRVMRTAKAMGYRAAAIHSEADAEAVHVRLADVATSIGPPEARASYLNIDAIIAAARRLGAEAVHPGYGFLSENADFARACAEAGLVFIGPSPDAIAAMGNKAEAKRRMAEADVPCLPGYQGSDQSERRLIEEAERIGFPVMVKAAAGGGGRGMRLVSSRSALTGAIAGARAEAESAFGSGELFLEKVLADARHVEIQVLADAHGNVIHLGERDCSVQRRHQKVVEEAPSPAVSEELRARMGAAAVAAASAIGYVNAGTVEFLLAGDGAFYFLEMNTRLQVEHPVTEMVTGLDLVELQIRIARGEPLPIGQADVRCNGHAIEARLYAEAPHKGFLPQSGRLVAWRPPAGAGIRVDHGLREGQDIGPYYDPLLAKVIAHGRDRDEARRRLIEALEETVALGPATNRGFLIDCLGQAGICAWRGDDAIHPHAFRRHQAAPGRRGRARSRGRAVVRSECQTPRSRSRGDLVVERRHPMARAARGRRRAGRRHRVRARPPPLPDRRRRPRQATSRWPAPATTVWRGSASTARSAGPRTPLPGRPCISRSAASIWPCARRSTHRGRPAEARKSQRRRYARP